MSDGLELTSTYYSRSLDVCGIDVNVSVALTELNCDPKDSDSNSESADEANVPNTGMIDSSSHGNSARIVGAQAGSYATTGTRIGVATSDASGGGRGFPLDEAPSVHASVTAAAAKKNADGLRGSKYTSGIPDEIVSVVKAAIDKCYGANPFV